jgi:hypothetical protein
VAGRDILLYDPIADAVHVLNATADSVWEMCDGRHSPAEIVTELRKRYGGTESADLPGDVESALRALAAKGLLRT